jgi:hypothetical protein
MATKKELTAVAKELNKVLGLDPAIDTGSRVKLADLEEAIKQAIELIEPEDEFTEATQAIITALSPAPQEEALEEEDDDDDDDDVEEEAPEGDEDDDDDDDDDDDEEEDDDDEDDDDEDEEEPVLKQDKKKKEPPLGKKEKTAGVIKSIIELIEKSGQKGISKEQILEELIKRFPDRQPTSMKNTINVQVPTRISKERFPLEKTPDNKFRRKK